MVEPWRTSTVVSLCEAMREARDYSAAPILADALQDAGYDDAAVLLALRENASPVITERAVALVYSEESKQAVTALDAFAALVGYTYVKVVDGIREYVATGEQYAGDAGYNYDDPDYAAAWSAQSATSDWRDGTPEARAAVETRDGLFAAFDRVTGRRVPDERRGDTPFTCPC